MMDITQTLRGYSRGLYANWLWHRPLRLIVDAGEGLSLALGTQVFSADVIALTHGHSDHVLGLAGFAAARRFGKGATTKPWTIVHPAGSPGVAAVRALLDTMWPGVDFPITWIALAPGEGVPLGRRTLETFPVVHSTREPSLGFCVRERRQRLNATFTGASPGEIEHHARQHGRDAVMEWVPHVVFAHTGDAMPIDPALVAGADLLVHDATFLETPERRDLIHATTAEALEVARAADVRTLVLHHLSVRYDRSTAFTVLRDQVRQSGFRGDCWWLDDERLVSLDSQDDRRQGG